MNNPYEGLAVFWFANIHNYVHNNVAVGGNSGYWLFTHSAYWTNQFDSIPFDAESGRREWKNNKGIHLEVTISSLLARALFQSKRSFICLRFFSK